VHLSWALIVLGNCAWVAILIARRRRDHGWLLPFFLSYTITDTIGYVCYSSKFGGLELFPFYRWNSQAWVVYANTSWLLWFFAPAIFALKLQFGRTRWWWWMAGVVPLLLIAFSEYLGAPTYTRRLLMHRAYEPVCLLLAAFVSVYYFLDRSSKGTKIDYSAFAVLLTSVMLALKLIVWLSPDLSRFNSIGARWYFLVHMLGLAIMYFAWPHIRSRELS
jgi:hypothetical protein